MRKCKTAKLQNVECKRRIVWDGITGFGFILFLLFMEFDKENVNSFIILQVHFDWRLSQVGLIIAYSWVMEVLQCQSVLFCFFSSVFWSDHFHPISKQFSQLLPPSIFSFRGSIVLQFCGFQYSSFNSFCESFKHLRISPFNKLFLHFAVQLFCSFAVFNIPVSIHSVNHSSIYAFPHSINYFYISRFNCFAVLRFPCIHA